MTDNNCHIASGTTIKGKIKSKGDLRVDGVIVGDVQTSGRLIVGTDGKVDGILDTDYTEVSGKLELKKISSKVLKLNSTAQFKGEVEVESLVVESGAIINGSISMKSKSSVGSGGFIHPNK